MTVPSSPSPNPLGKMDLWAIVLLSLLLFFIFLITREWMSPLQQVPLIHLEGRYLPLYLLFSLSRGIIAYGISFLFTMIYGYVMARVTGAERFMLPLLDILQSIPVLGFLPGFVLGLVYLFPQQNIGLEIASILMIFTGQVWNMTFSFYSSLKSVPPDLVAVARLSRLSWSERFIRLDLSYATTGLLWNSMMSMAGGWFFLMVSEAFVLGEHDFRLPGIGSYMSLAIERGDGTAQGMGVLAMLGMIVFVDQIVWRPLVNWSHKFTDEEATVGAHPWFWKQITQTWTYWKISRLFLFLFTPLPLLFNGIRHCTSKINFPGYFKQGSKLLLYIFIGLLVLGGAVKYLQLLMTLESQDWIHLLTSTGATFIRVTMAVLLASLWTIPVGVIIGRHPRWVHFLQPIIQMAASFPAPMIFPVVVGVMLGSGIGLGMSSVVLLLLGSQWYILFNVIAGSSSIPRELWEVSQITRLTFFQRWRHLILPAIFPSLLTGWITAMGGAWNASIVAEYMKYHGETLLTTGLGSTISQSTEQGNFHILAAAVGIMAITVVSFNRLVWRPLSHYAQTRFTMET
ncbi:MAG: ABC transporter permease subunit [Verrucomicrobiota bacterium]